MNLLYAAVQQQGGKGSVESAMGPYLAMNGMNHNNNNINIKNLHNSALDSMSTIYAQIDSAQSSLVDFPLHASSPTPTGRSPSKLNRSSSSRSGHLRREQQLLAERRDLM